MRLDLTAGIAALVTTSITLPLVAFILRRGGVYDRPSSRSSHETPTLRGAGAAQLVGMSVSWGTLGWSPFPGFVAPLAFGFLGLIDDLRSQTVSIRLAVQLGLGFLAGLFLIDLDSPYLLTAASLLVICLLFVVTTNAANFMDGVNGISALHGVVLGFSYWWLLADVGSDWAPISAALVGASIAFLPWNWGRQARLFLGDSGSYLLGALLASFATAAVMAGTSPLVAIAPLSVYLADVLATLGKRWRAQKAVAAPHREHVYQQLTQTGMSHPQTASWVATFSAAAAGIAIVAQLASLSTLVLLLLLTLIVFTYLALPSIRMTRKP